MENTTNPSKNSPDNHLKDKVILITGAAHRIGARTAKVLHRQGARLILHYRSSKKAAYQLSEELNNERKDSVVLLQENLLDTEKLATVIKNAVSTWGQLDALINNASTFYPTPMGNVEQSHWEDLMGSNLKAPFFLSQAAAPYLSKTQGCIVNIVDIHADRPLKKHPVYSMAKAGLAMMTKSLACELGPEVRVNGVAPGAILWPEDELDDITKQRIISRTFLKRRGEPEDIATAILFLIRDGRYVSGHILTVDGGRSLNA